MNFSKNFRLKPAGKWSHLTQLYWACNYDPTIIFDNYPNLTSLQEVAISTMFNCISKFKRKASKGNVFPILP